MGRTMRIRPSLSRQHLILNVRTREFSRTRAIVRDFGSAKPKMANLNCTNALQATYLTMKNIDVRKRERFRVPRLQICYEFRPNPHPYNCGYRNWSPFFLNGADSRSIFIVCFFKYGEGRPRHINQNILENINKLTKKKKKKKKKS